MYKLKLADKYIKDNSFYSETSAYYCNLSHMGKLPPPNSINACPLCDTKIENTSIDDQWLYYQCTHCDYEYATRP